MKIFLDATAKRVALRRLLPYFKKLGHEVLRNPKGCDVQLSVIRISRKTKLPTVLRLDGVYYDSKMNYKRKNKEIGRSHASANGIIYQSETSKQMCEKYLLPRRAKVFRVVHNGCLKGWTGDPITHKGINIVTAAKWRRPKRFVEIVDVFTDFLKYYPKAQLHVLGSFRAKRGGRKIKHKNIHYYGMVKHNKMQEIYRKCDIFIHLCKKDSCPNTVVEAIAAGLPVVTTNACGGATEMCRLTDGCIICKGDRLTLNPEPIYTDAPHEISKKLKDDIVEAMVQIAKDKRHVVLPEQLTLKYVARQYLEVMEQTIKHPKKKKR